MTDRDWRLVREEALDGTTAMAYDEIAAETVADGGPATVRVYRWEPSTLSLGYHQPAADVDFDHCDDRGVRVTRRPTGGGAIYHDTDGDVAYSIIAPAESVPGNLMDAYELLCEPLFDCFSELGVDARFVNEEREAIYEPACYLREMHPAHDVVAGADGRKLSGNAQYRQKAAVIQHGSILYESPAGPHLDCFAEPGVTEAAFRDRVTSITEQAGGDIERGRVVRVLEDALADWADADEGAWRDGERERARELAEAKYASAAWVRDREDPTD